jgi:hypothetical protein
MTLRLLACALISALALTAFPAAAKKKAPPKVAHPHLTMLKLRLAKFLPPGQDKKKLGDIDLQYTVLADSTILRHKTVDFLVREFAVSTANQAGMEAVAGLFETVPPIDSPDSAQICADRLAKVRKKAIRSDVEDKTKKLAMATLAGTLRSICKRVADEEPTDGLSKKQLYTKDSFEADKLGDDILKVFRSTMDAGLDSEEHGLGQLVEDHLRALVKYARPVDVKQLTKKKKKKKRKK